MKFIVKTGKHSKSIEAIDFNHAAQIFLKSLFQDEEEPKLGSVISVSCEVTEQFLHTSEALRDLDAYQKMQLYKGTDGGQRPN